MRVEYTDQAEFLDDLQRESEDGTKAVRVTKVDRKHENELGLIDVSLVATYINMEGDLCELVRWCGQDIDFCEQRELSGTEAALSVKGEVSAAIAQMGFAVQGGRFNDG